MHPSLNTWEEKHAQQASDPWMWCSPLSLCISDWWSHVSMFKWDTSTNWDPAPLIISRYFGLLLSSAEFYGSTKKTRKGVLVLFGGVITEKGQVLCSTVGNDVEMRSRSLNVKDSENKHKHFLSPRSGTIAHCWEEGIAEKPADSETGDYFL